MEYAHSQGIIHRDIKPANLLRDGAGTVKVTDLGLARLANAAGSAAGGSITQAGSILGTVDYMPPEQAMDSTEIDHRSDIYSLGTTLHFLLLGRPPYQGDSLMAIMFKHKLDPIPVLADSRQDVPAELDAAFQRMMAKEPAGRFQTMTEVVQTLEAIAANLPDTSKTAPAGLGPPGRTSSTGQWSLLGSSPETSRATAGGATQQMFGLRSASAGTPLSSLKILLVEPSRTLSGIIQKYLQVQGVQNIVAAASGEDALRSVRAERPHAIVSALHLPDMTGVDLAQQVRAEADGPPPGFVLISSESESSDAGSLSKCANTVLVKKPFTPEQLVSALRVVSDVAQPNVAQPDAPAKDRGKLRVLIVDDSAAARLHVRNVLGGMGLTQFVDATDGAQAVAAVAQESFDLIITDYNMPLMDGPGLVGYLKQNPLTASVPIIMVTTETDPTKLETVRRLGVAAVCDKSFPAAIVRTIIDELVVASR